MLALATDVELDHHDTGPGHPERPARLEAALAGVADCALGSDLKRVEPRMATTEELQLVHAPSYIEQVRELAASGGGMLDPDTVVSAGSFETAMFAAGAGLEVLEALREGGADVGFVAVRPPGHHALTGRGMGFCLFNNVALAARTLASRGERVAVIDWDVHHGNGTQEIFWDDPMVAYVSMHQWPLYPGTGRLDERGGAGAPGGVLNLPLPPGATGDVLVRAMDEVVAPLLDGFAPSWLLVSAGFDGHRADPLGGWQLTAGDYADLAARLPGLLAEGTKSKPAGRIALFLEGGYDLHALRSSVAATLSALAGREIRPEPSSCGGPGMAVVERAIEMSRA